jgi:hypothetical protein
MHNINNEIYPTIIICNLRKMKGEDLRQIEEEREAYSHGIQCCRLSATARRTARSWPETFFLCVSVISVLSLRLLSFLLSSLLLSVQLFEAGSPFRVEDDLTIHQAPTSKCIALRHVWGTWFFLSNSFDKLLRTSSF